MIVKDASNQNHIYLSRASNAVKKRLLDGFGHDEPSTVNFPDVGFCEK
jgi:hypothetical protein